jgi:hypothetical protein
LPGEPTQCHFVAQAAGLQAEQVRSVHQGSVSHLRDRLMGDPMPKRTRDRQVKRDPIGRRRGSGNSPVLMVAIRFRHKTITNGHYAA